MAKPATARRKFSAAAATAAVAAATVAPAQTAVNPSIPATIEGLRAEFDRLFSANDRASQDLVRLAAETPTPTEEQTRRINSLKAEVDHGNARLTVLRDAIEARKQAAQFARKDGTVDNPIQPPGQPATEAHRQEERGEFDADAVRRNLSIFIRSQGRDSRAFTTVTSSTGSGIMLPVRVLPPLVVGLDHVVARAKAYYGLTPRLLTTTTETINQPAFTGTGGKITQGATSNTPRTPDVSDSYRLAMEPYGSNVQYFQNTILNAVDFDPTQAVIPQLRLDLVAGQQADMLTTIKAVSGLISASTRTATTSGLTYANVLAWIEALPARWQATQFSVVSPSAYSAILGLTSDAGNRLVQVTADGTLLVKGTPVYKDHTAGLDAFGGTTRILGITMSGNGVTIRDNPNLRLNVYVNDQRRDQTGLDLVQDHAFGYSTSSVVLLATPAS